MKKDVIAILALNAVVASIAHAQSAVTIYGSFDAGVRTLFDANANSNSRLTMGSTGTYNSNRLGVRGVEDLGGGLNAHFTLETGFNSGTGAQADAARFFSRSAFVGIGGSWGSLDLGRQYTVAFKTVGAYEPFNFKYTAIVPVPQSSASAGTRYDNDIQYTGTFGPLTARAEYSLGERTGSNDGSAAAIGGTYTDGPISVGAAYTKRKINVLNTGVGASGTPPVDNSVAAPNNSAFQDNTHVTFGGAYKFGNARIAAGYAREKQNIAVGGDVTQKNAWLGGSYDFSQALGLTAAYYDTKIENINASKKDGKRQLFIVGTTYALSKRTNLYADLDFTRYKDATIGATTGAAGPLFAPAGQSVSKGFSVGVNHLF